MQKLIKPNFDLTKEQIIEMLTTFDSEELFRMAREVRNENWPKPSVRAVIEISNYCRGSCYYCAIRKQNLELHRYRMTKEEIVGLVKGIYKKGIKMVMLQSGEDLELMPTLIPAVAQIRKEMPNLKITVCCGERSLGEFKALKKAGANAYLIKLETTNNDLFNEYKSYTTFKSREEAMENVRKAGLKLGTGVIVGLPRQSHSDIADDIMYFAKVNSDMVSGCPFMPNANSPLENEPACSLEYSLRVHAILRLLLPKASIPSCSPYEILKKGGQLDGFNAGANNITINATPWKYRRNYPLYSKHRVYISPEHVKEIIKLAQPNWGFKLEEVI